jgi:hypothetical protein
MFPSSTVTMSSLIWNAFWLSTQTKGKTVYPSHQAPGKEHVQPSVRLAPYDRGIHGIEVTWLLPRGRRHSVSKTQTGGETWHQRRGLMIEEEEKSLAVGSHARRLDVCIGE